VAAGVTDEEIAKRADAVCAGPTDQQLAAAAQLEATSPDAAKEIRAAAARAAQARDLGVRRDDVLALLTLQRLRAFVAGGIFDALDKHVAALRAVHERVNAWVQADEPVAPARVAAVVDDVIGAVAKDAGGAP
jgi:hypothetical protein